MLWSYGHTCFSNSLRFLSASFCYRSGIGYVSYFRAILRLCAFLLHRRFAVFRTGILFDRAFYSAFVFSATLQDICCRITETIFFAVMCHFPGSISFVCSISPSSWVSATTSAIEYIFICKTSSTAPPFILLLLFYALRVSSREPIRASFSKGGIFI